MAIAAQRGLCDFYHETVMIQNFPAGGKVVVEFLPAKDVIWIEFALTFGDLASDAWDMYHRHKDVVYHRDPSKYSVIGVPEYPLWNETSVASPDVFYISNISAETQSCDITFWVMEFTKPNYELFKRYMDEIYEGDLLRRQSQEEMVRSLKKIAEEQEKLRVKFDEFMEKITTLPRR